ncbi:MAG: phosphoribosyltransferase family protein, partial [Dysgonamonadaceae bacterium]|nr:phosphoribosyltransferase family protein [Dysgonamonadaceae bacterium]
MTSEQNYKGQIVHFSLHTIYSIENPGFIPEEYSKFKHGAENIARKYGYELADKFISNCFSKRYTGGKILILPGAYSHIPTASFYMKKYFVDKLNAFLYAAGYPVTEELKIYRSVSYREDYGEMSAEQRYSLIKNDTFYIDRNFVENKIILHLDDIKITGTHERIIINMLNNNNLNNDCYMLYFAELCSNEIQPSI